MFDTTGSKSGGKIGQKNILIDDDILDSIDDELLMTIIRSSYINNKSYQNVNGWRWRLKSN